MPSVSGPGASVPPERGRARLPPQGDAATVAVLLYVLANTPNKISPNALDTVENSC